MLGRIKNLRFDQRAQLHACFLFQLLLFICFVRHFRHLAHLVQCFDSTDPNRACHHERGAVIFKFAASVFLEQGLVRAETLLKEL